MRLLHVFSSFEVGGQQMRTAALANAFAADDAGPQMHHLILPLNGDLSCEQNLEAGVSWEPARAPAAARGGLVRRVLAARRAIAVYKPDVLITYNWGAIEWAAAALLSPKTCRHLHIEDGFGPEEAGGQILRRVLFRRLVLSWRTKVAFPSHTLYAIARDVWRLPARALVHIPNGIDLAPFGSVTRQEARARFDLPAETLIIGTLATLRPEKNLKRLIDAFRAVRAQVDCHLVIAGAGGQREALEAHVKSLALDDAVSFPGFVEQPHTILPAFDIFALSSDTEQMPLSILEAMATGLCIASTDVGDVARMVAAEARPFVTGSDARALENSLLALARSPQAREKSGKANQSLAENELDWEKMLASWKSLFIYG